VASDEVQWITSSRSFQARGPATARCGRLMLTDMLPAQQDLLMTPSAEDAVVQRSWPD